MLETKGTEPTSVSGARRFIVEDGYAEPSVLINREKKGRRIR